MGRRLLVAICLCVCSGCSFMKDNSVSTASSQDTTITYPPITQEETTIPQEDETEKAPKQETQGDETTMEEYEMIINGISFDLTLYDNATTQAWKEQLPTTITMDEMHGNEKFHYLEQSLPTQSEMVRTIESGDVMLFGSDCLVLFYESFATSYSYTRLGKIADTKAFREAINQGSLEVTIQVK